MECGLIQNKWATTVGADIGIDPGHQLSEALTNAWRQVENQTVHMFRDEGDEECYHTLYMKRSIERAGKRAKIVHSLNDISRDAFGNILDKDGELITTIWKTWSWETIIEQVRQENEESVKKILKNGG